MNHTEAGKTVNDLILNAQRNDSQRIDAYQPDRLGSESRIRRKQPHKEGAGCPGQNEQDQGVDPAQKEDILLGTFHPVIFSGAVIERKDRLRSSGDTAKGHGYHQHKALNDGGAGDQHIALLWAAVGLKDGIHGDYHYIIHGNDNKRREA